MTKTHKSPDEETVDKDMQQAKRTPPPPPYMVIPPLLFDLLFYFFHQNVLTPFTLSQTSGLDLFWPAITIFLQLM